MTLAPPRSWTRIALLCLCLGLACGACASTSWPERGPVDAQLLEARYPDEDIIVLDATRTIRYRVHGGEPVTEVETWSRTLYVEPEEHGHITLTAPYRKSFDEILEMSARVTRPDGDTREFTLDDADDFIKHSYALYSDERRRELDVDGLVPGAIVETRIVERTRDVRLMPASYTFGGPRPIVHEAVFVEAPVGWEVDFYLADGDEEFERVPEPERVGSVNRWRWQIDDQPAYEFEARASDERPLLRTRLTRWSVGGRTETGFATEAELSAGKYAMIAHALVPSEPLDDTVAGILGDVDMTDERAVVATLHAWVRDRISYCSIPIGYGGWVPHDVDQILDLGYGDCKDKATTLKALLDTLGIESALINVYSHDGIPRTFDILTIAGNFNHAILRVTLSDGERIFADPTAGSVPFGEVPWSLYGAPVLALTPEGEAVDRIAVPEPETNLRRVVGVMRLVEEAPATAELELELTGVWTHRLWGGIDGVGEGDKVKRVRELLDLRSVDVDAADISQPSVTALPTPVTVRARGSAPRLALPADGPRTLAARDLLTAAWPHLEPDDDRKGTLYFGEPSVLEHEIRVELPPDWQVTRLPPVAAGQSPEAAYLLNWEHDATTGVLVLRSRFELRDPTVSAGRYEALRAFLDDAQAAQTATFVLAPTTPTLEATR